jgi:hypothetical protein
MGLLVVANLAGRHQIDVELENVGQGIRARVWLPSRLLAVPRVHRANGRYGGRVISADDLDAPAHRPLPGVDATDAHRTGDEVEAGTTTPVPTAPGTTAPPAGIPVVTVAGNTASLRRAVARTVGDGGGVSGAVAVAVAGTDPAVAGPAVSGPGRARSGGTPPRRSTPTRAEDVLGAARGANAEPSRWWSRTGPTTPDRPQTPTPRSSVSAGTSSAGLPIRLPMAQLPGRTAVPAQRVGSEPVRPTCEPEPSDVGTMLSRFYGGVRRATAEHAGEAEDAGH